MARKAVLPVSVDNSKSKFDFLNWFKKINTKHFLQRHRCISLYVPTQCAVSYDSLLSRVCKWMRCCPDFYSTYYACTILAFHVALNTSDYFRFMEAFSKALREFLWAHRSLVPTWSPIDPHCARPPHPSHFRVASVSSTSAPRIQNESLEHQTSAGAEEDDGGVASRYWPWHLHPSGRQLHKKTRRVLRRPVFNTKHDARVAAVEKLL